MLQLYPSYLFTHINHTYSNPIHYKLYLQLVDIFIVYFALYFLNFELYVIELLVANKVIYILINYNIILCTARCTTHTCSDLRGHILINVSISPGASSFTVNINYMIELQNADIVLKLKSLSLPSDYLLGQVNNPLAVIHRTSGNLQQYFIFHYHFIIMQS